MHRLTTPSTTTPRGILARVVMGMAAAPPLQVERGGEVAGPRARAGERLEAEALRDELDDRRRIVARVVDVAALRERRDDDRRDASARTPAVAQARARGRRGVVPVAAVLVVGVDHGHAAPLRAP